VVWQAHVGEGLPALDVNGTAPCPGLIEGETSFCPLSITYPAKTGEGFCCYLNYPDWDQYKCESNPRQCQMVNQGRIR